MEQHVRFFGGRGEGGDKVERQLCEERRLMSAMRHGYLPCERGGELGYIDTFCERISAAWTFSSSDLALHAGATLSPRLTYPLEADELDAICIYASQQLSRERVKLHTSVHRSRDINTSHPQNIARVSRVAD